MNPLMQGKFHYGRSFGGAGWIEAICPCPKEACGLVMTPHEDCKEHDLMRAKTIRSMHRDDECPAKKEAA